MDQPGKPPILQKSFTLKALNDEEEKSYDFTTLRNHPKPITVTGAVMHMVKGALGAGVLSGHAAYKTGGVWVALILNVGLGFYLTVCLELLVRSAQILYRRANIHTMSYPEVAEAAFSLYPNAKISRFAKASRYTLDFLICLDLFGACTAYQLLIAFTVKQLVENVQISELEGQNGYPHLRVYMACLIIPYILICWIVHLKWLAPFSMCANMLILLCLGVSIYYASILNPSFTGMVPYRSLYNTLEYCGMMTFAMSCAGVVIPVENVMGEPTKFPRALHIAMGLNTLIMLSMSFFGYAAFLEDSKPPVTVNYPMTTFNKLLKGFMGLMIYVTHAINFWVPFNTVFVYLKRRHKSRFMFWELFWRALFVIMIAFIGIIFPSVEAIMGFLGNFCLSMMGFVYPNVICLLTIWHRPGLGKYKWKLWRGIFFIVIGLFLTFCGSMVSLASLVTVFTSNI